MRGIKMTRSGGFPIEIETQISKIITHTVPGQKSWTAGCFLKQNYPKACRIWLLPYQRQFRKEIFIEAK